MVNKDSKNQLNKQYQQEDQFILSQVDKNKLYIEWKLSHIKKEVVSTYFDSPFNSYQQVIMIYDLTDRLYENYTHFVQEIKLKKQQMSLVLILKLNRTYRIEYGIKLSGHKFFPLLRSNSVILTSSIPFDCIEKGRMDLGKEIEIDLPNWEEHVSTYSYYERSTKKDHT